MYLMEPCYCPTCKSEHLYPLNREAMPPVHRHGTINLDKLYRAQCHPCQTKTLSKDTKKMWDGIFDGIRSRAFHSSVKRLKTYKVRL